jgi:alpha-L-rhamnosidase
MKTFRFALILFLFSLKSIAQNTAKPWAYWWWQGSAVNKADLRANLQKYAEAGFGGLHIIPIYGVKGEEQNFIHFLSPKWLEMLDYTVKEADSLHLGIDMTLGTGWPFGGVDVKPENAAKTFELVYEPEREPTLKMFNTKQKVKRAAPGAEGLVLDHFDKANVEHYLSKFDSVFAKNNIGIRAFYNDSYEVYGADWTAYFFEKFKAKRGYELGEHLHVFETKAKFTEEEKQVYADYQLTISELLLEEFTQPYAAFAKKYGKLSRNESHGSPGNVLDLYAANSIPETEFFGSKPFDIPLFRQDPDYSEKQFGRPNKMVLKLASSPANIFQKKLVSSETATWLGNHFKVSLSQVKPIIDESFLGGVNHVFYHGANYTPLNAPWPGWMFYASTNFNFNSHFWNELPLLNKYIENCQNLLQNSKPDNEILVYFPVQDLWHQPKKGVYMMDVHNIEKNGIFTDKYRKLLKDLENAGYSFDFVSDLQICQMADQKIDRSNYKTLIIPEVEYMPLTTLAAIKRLNSKGLEPIFEKTLPKKTTGFLNLIENQQIFEKELEELKITIAPSVVSRLKTQKVKRESLHEKGLDFLRKRYEDGLLYFISNHHQVFEEGDLSFDNKLKYSYLYDPKTNEWLEIEWKKGGIFKKIRLELKSGESLFLFFSNIKKVNIKPYSIKNYKNIEDLSRNWNLVFTEGNPEIPEPQSFSSLKSWALADSIAGFFNGYGEYKKTFTLPEGAVGKPGQIKLGDVRETAEVWINDTKVGTAWCLPYNLEIPAGLLKTQNEIKIKVRNLSANEIKYMDSRQVNWKKFYDINMVDIQYKPFNASSWKPVDSGLLGPIIFKY